MIKSLPQRDCRKGFTIVELIIVIAVIGVLAAILIPTFSAVIDKANIASVKSDAKNMNTAVISESIEPDDGAANSPISLDEAVYKVVKSGYAMTTVVCQKDGLDIMWTPTFNRFVVVATEGTGIDTVVTEILYPQEVIEASQSAASITEYIGLANLQSTRTIATASTRKMEAYFDQIDDANGAAVTLQAASSSDFASLAEMSSSFDQNGDAFPGIGYASDFANVTIEVTSDLYLGSTQWTPFGECPKKPFQGTIEGNGHTIYGLTNTGYAGGYEFTTATTRSVGEAYGLIAYAGTIKNGGAGDISVSISDLTIENVAIEAESGVCVGAFVGYVMVNNAASTSNLTLTNCTASGSISGKNDIGGLVGKFYGNNILMENCENNVNVKAQTGTDVWATKSGGLIGYVSVSVGRTVTLKNCVNNGSVTTINVAENNAATRNYSTSYAGGLIGGNGNSKGTLTFESCTNTGAISAQANSSECAGQLMGSSSSSTGTTYKLRGTNVFTGTIDADKFESHFNSQMNNSCYLVTLTTNPDVVLLGYTALMCYTADYYPTVMYAANTTINGTSIAGASLQTTSYLNVNNPTTVSVALVAE